MGKKQLSILASTLLLLLLVFPLAAQTDGKTEADTTPEETETAAEPSESDEAQDTSEEGSGFAFNMGIGLGATVVDGETYQTMAFYPDIAFGKLGIGLDLNLRYRFIITNSGESQFAVRQEDWIVPDGTFSQWLNLYLSKIEYIRWAQKGAPLYLKAGTLTGATLGTGFTMGGYSNALFKPETKIFGTVADMDGRLFEFPYVGIESVIGNVAQMDVMGARFYVRPLAGIELPVIKALQVGASVMADNKPYLYLSDEDSDGYYDGTAIADGTKAEPVVLSSIDTILPVLSNDVATLSLFADVAFQPEGSTGVMTGLGGKLINLITYGGQLRFLGKNFIPVYFGPDYDITRAQRYMVATSTETVINPYAGYLLSTGLSLLEDQFTTQISVDAPFNPPADAEDRYKYPHLSGSIVLAEDVIPAFFFEAHYDKYGIKSFKDFLNAEDALIGATLNYKSGPAVISMVVDVQYNPASTTNPNVETWDVSTRLETRISF